MHCSENAGRLRLDNLLSFMLDELVFLVSTGIPGILEVSLTLCFVSVLIHFGFVQV